MKKVRIFIVLLIVLFGISITTVVFAKYYSSKEIKDSAKVALFIIDDTVDKISLKLTDEDITPGNEYIYSFDINNYKNSKRTETIIDYTIKIDSSQNLPLQYEILKNGTKLNLTDNETEVQTLLNDKNQTDEYILKIIYLDTDDSYQYASMLEYVDIIIDAEQKT